MKRKTFVKITLLLLIVLAAGFLYLYLTRSTILQALPFLPQRENAPSFLYYLTEPLLSAPTGIASDDFGNMYVADTRNSRILVFDKNGRRVREIREPLQRPVGVALRHGRIYVADLAAQQILAFSQDGTLRGVLLASGESKEVGTFNPTAIAVERESGDIYFTDAAWHRVIVLDQEGNYKFAVGSAGVAEGKLLHPNGIVLDDEKNIYVADSNNGRVQVFSPDGSRVIRVLTGGAKPEEAFALPRGMAIDGRGRLWVVDSLSHSVSVFDGDRKLFAFGTFGIMPGEFYFPSCVAMDGAGKVYITERGKNRVSVFSFSPTPLAGLRR